MEMFETYESTFDSSSDSDFLSFSYLPWNPNKSMASNTPKHMGMEDFETHYISEERMTFFRSQACLSGTSDVGKVIL